MEILNLRGNSFKKVVIYLQGLDVCDSNEVNFEFLRCICPNKQGQSNQPVITRKDTLQTTLSAGKTGVNIDWTPKQRDIWKSITGEALQNREYISCFKFENFSFPQLLSPVVPTLKYFCNVLCHPTTTVKLPHLRFQEQRRDLQY